MTRGIAPPLLVGGALSYEAMIRYHGEFELGVLIWVFCYGLALLAMGPVAPRSLRRLGWVFIAAGLFVFVLWREFGAAVRPAGSLSEVESASWIMIGTFGVLHLLHGGGVLMRKAKGEGEGELD